MDEATSALDFETERQLCLNLQNWANGKTVFFITHRLSTIRNADSIIFMDSSKIVETGTHEELISQKGLYYALYRHQVD